MKNFPKYIGLLLVLAIFGLSACGNTRESHSNLENAVNDKEHSEDESSKVVLTPLQFESLQMKTGTLQKRKMNGYVEVNGLLEVPPQNEATITSIVGANIVSIEVIEGDKVTKGQTVAYISHPNIIQRQTDFLNAFNSSRFLRKEYERQKTLYDAGVGSGATFQKSEAEYQESLSMVRGLEAQLRQLNINSSSIKNGDIQQRVALRTPIEGYVQNVSIKTGQYVEPQTDLFEVVDTHHVHADLMVFEKDVFKVKEGQKVVFNVQSIPSEELTAEIYSVGKTFEQDPKALHVHAEIENKEGNLIPGMYIQGRIQIDSSKMVAFSESAIAKDGDRSYVFSTSKENEKWVFTPVEVLPGIKDGDWVSVSFLKPVDTKITFALNNAYYLMGEMKKGEAEHNH
ncbi:efflux RND transporter periplasmic adaptor subunit [uncultured Kriegella sp.]|uniref:efflux RND transporter periplasmic adaptor subunit n=1 Tax=uncultured Kriegella sp. TaxID=1798910 RepID=UPI0030DCDB86